MKKSIIAILGIALSTVACTGQSEQAKLSTIPLIIKHKLSSNIQEIGEIDNIMGKKFNYHSNNIGDYDNNINITINNNGNVVGSSFYNRSQNFWIWQANNNINLLNIPKTELTFHIDDFNNNNDIIGHNDYDYTIIVYKNNRFYINPPIPYAYPFGHGVFTYYNESFTRAVVKMNYYSDFYDCDLLTMKCIVNQKLSIRHYDTNINRFWTCGALLEQDKNSHIYSYGSYGISDDNKLKIATNYNSGTKYIYDLNNDSFSAPDPSISCEIKQEVGKNVVIKNDRTQFTYETTKDILFSSITQRSYNTQLLASYLGLERDKISFIQFSNNGQYLIIGYILSTNDNLSSYKLIKYFLPNGIDAIISDLDKIN